MAKKSEAHRPAKTGEPVSKKRKEFSLYTLRFIELRLDEGATLETIADALDTDIDTLMVWVDDNPALKKLLDREDIRCWSLEKVTAAKQLVAMGYSRWEIIKALEVSSRTFLIWELKHYEFHAALRITPEAEVAFITRTWRSVFGEDVRVVYH